MNDGTKAKGLDQRFDELKARVERLEYRESRAFRLLDSAKDPWLHFVLERDLDADQVNGIEQVMGDVQRELAEGRQVEEFAFEQRLLPYIPDKQKPCGIPHHFVQYLLSEIPPGHEWYGVRKHFAPHRP